MKGWENTERHENMESIEARIAYAMVIKREVQRELETELTQ